MIHACIKFTLVLYNRVSLKLFFLFFFKFCCKIDALEYIHCHEYTHGDIKGSNLMMGFSKSKSGQVSDVCTLKSFTYTN